MNSPKPTHYFTDAAILANAQISDQREIMRINELVPDVQAHIVSARLQGFHPVSVRWPGGQFALMFCEPGCQWPNPHKVIAAYRQCLQTSQVFPEGTHNA